MKNKKFIIAGLLIATVAFAAGVKEDIFKIGKLGSSADKVLELGETRKIRSNETSGKLQFTNDGTIYKDLGSGSGSGSSGVNTLSDLNADFEDGATVWTATGGAFSIDSATPIFGLNSGVILTTLSGQKIASGTGPLELGFKGRACQLDFIYTYEEASVGYEYIIKDGPSGVVLVQADLPITTSTPVRVFRTFDCPDPATKSLVFEIQAKINAAGQLKFDDVFLGQGRNSLNVSQASIIGTARWEGAASNCRWPNTSSTMTEMPADLDCPDPVVTGQAAAASTKVPRVELGYLPPGKYEVLMNATGDVDGSGSDCAFQMTDGTDFRGAMYAFDSSYQDRANSLIGVFEYPNGKAGAYFALASQRESGSGTCQFLNETGRPTTFIVKRYPLSDSSGLNLETSSQILDVRIANNSTFGPLPYFGGSEAELNASNLVLYASDKDSVNTKIACEGSNPATGNTCAVGSENVGVEIDVAVAGVWEVCVGLNWQNLSVSTTVEPFSFKMKTVESDGTTTKEVSRLYNHNEGSSVGTAGQHQSVANRMCSMFNMDAGKNIVKMFYRRASTNTILYVASGGTGFGNAEISVTGYPINQQFPQPVFTEIDDALRNRIEATESAGPVKYCGTRVETFGGSGAILNDVGDCVASVTRTATGDYTVNYTSPYAQDPVCSCSAVDNWVVGCDMVSVATTGARVRLSLQETASSVFYDAAQANEGFMINCFGAK